MKPLKSLVVIFTPQKCVRVFHPYNGYPAAKDNRNSCGTCTTSTECKTVITVVLTVMRGMDPHMISGDLGWVLVMSWLCSVEVGFFRLWVSHGETP
jgi:hypothetical protein